MRKIATFYIKYSHSDQLYLHSLRITKDPMGHFYLPDVAQYVKRSLIEMCMMFCISALYLKTKQNMQVMLTPIKKPTILHKPSTNQWEQAII